MGLGCCSHTRAILDLFLNKKSFIIICGIVSLLSLSLAYVAQHGFDVNPCILCYYERYVYWAVVGLMLIALVSHWQAPSSESCIMRILFIAIGLVLLGGLVLGLYHLGVEWHWWEGTASCKGITQKATSIEEMRQLINQKTPARCDQPNWIILGISATLWNVLWYLGFVVLWGATWIRTLSRR